MLRLRPSEIVLTPEDVEETLRRMAQREAIKSSAGESSQPGTQSGPPVLRRGPQRAVRDAITNLGDIPILRPQPQQAVHSAVDEDIDDSPEIHPEGSREQTDRATEIVVPVPDGQTNPLAPSASSALRILQLPFRLGRGHRRSSSRPTVEEHQVQGGSGRRSHPSQVSTDNPSEAASPGRAGADAPHYDSPASGSSAAGLRGGGGTAKRRAPPTSPHPRSSSSPPLQGTERSPRQRRRSSSRQRRYESSGSDEPAPILLRGYFTKGRQGEGPGYWFDEYIRAPQTEPRRHRNRRQSIPTRSHSFGSAPRTTSLYPSDLVPRATGRSGTPRPNNRVPVPPMMPMDDAISNYVSPYGHTINPGVNFPTVAECPSPFRVPSSAAFAPIHINPMRNDSAVAQSHDFSAHHTSRQHGLPGGVHASMSENQFQNSMRLNPEASPFHVDSHPASRPHTAATQPRTSQIQQSSAPSPRQSSSDETIFSELTSFDELVSGLQQPATQPRTSHIQQPSAPLPRQFSSEASVMSEPFSFYELVSESRQPSGEHHEQTQYDGTAAPRYGSYFSGRPLQHQAMSPFLTPAHTDAALGGQHGVSPLPSLPYTRPQNPAETQNSLNAPTAQLSRDAALAAMQNRASPLASYNEHYQQLLVNWNARRLADVQVPPQPRVDPEPRRLAVPQNARNQSGRRQGRGPDVQAPLQTERRPTNQPRPESQRGTATQASQAHERRPTTQSRPEPHGNTITPAIQASERRANQRSSENVPVRPPDQSSGPSRNSQVQMHRAVFENLHQAMQNRNPRRSLSPQQRPARRSLPPAAPRDTSNRPRQPGVHPPPPSTTRQRLNAQRPPPVRPPTRGQQPRSSTTDPNPQGRSSAEPSSDPPLDASRLRGGGPPDSTYTRTRRRATPIPPPIHRSSRRDVPPIPVALDHASASTGIRAPVTRAMTSARQHRRIPPQQRDQENSGAGEEVLMRLEADAITARHGGEERGEVMDETPPRVGRVERRMFT